MADIIEFDPATDARRVVAHIEAELHDVGFSTTPGHDRLAITPRWVITSSCAP